MLVAEMYTYSWGSFLGLLASLGGLLAAFLRTTTVRVVKFQGLGILFLGLNCLLLPHLK